MTASRNPTRSAPRWALGCFSAALVLAVQAQAPTATPIASPSAMAPTEPFTEQRHGLTLNDPYRWMEAPERQDALRAWLRSATEQGIAPLAALPAHAAWRKVMSEATQPGTRYVSVQQVGQRLFVRRTLVGQSTAQLVLIEGGRERVLFDPLTEPGLAINSLSVAPDGRTVGLVASKNGSEVGEVRFIDVASGREVGQRFGPNWGEFRPMWLDGRRVVLTRMGDGPQGNAMATMVAFHTVLGAKPQPIFGHGLSGNAATQSPEFPFVSPQATGPWTLALASNARADARLLISPSALVRQGKPVWQPVAGYDDRINGAALIGNTLYLLTTLTHSQGEIVAHTLDAQGRPGPRRAVFHDPSFAITGLEASRDGLYLTGTRDGVALLRHLPGGRAPAREVPLPFEGSMDALSLSADGSTVVAALSGWTQPRTYYRLRAGRFAPLGLASEGWAPAKAFSVRRELARSADGTTVPMVILRASAAPGPQPAVVEGYGAYGVPTAEPWYNAPLLAWVSRGNTLAMCGTRGGNERGRAWHEAGREANKPNAHADFTACGQRLLELGFTTPAQLAATGTSAGGLLGPVVGLQRPDLFRAVVARVAVVNPTRLEAMANGPNQYAEMGDPRTEAGFQALMKQDAYQMLQARAQASTGAQPLPQLFVTIGLNDQRVAPWMGAKFAAAALAQSAGRSLVLVRADDAQGHGVGSALGKQVDEFADTFSFLEHVLGPGAPAR